MDLPDLRTFVAVAETASFSRAAEQLHMAQPAISQRIKRLERDLGGAVFSRSTRRVELTESGARLLERARFLLDEVTRTEEEIRQLSSGHAGLVSVGFVGTATYDLLPRVARRIREALPGVNLELHGEQLSPTLIEDLHARRLDVVVTRDPSPEGNLKVHRLRAERLIAVLPADHPATRRKTVRLADLKSEAFITHPSGARSVMHAAVLQACRQAGFEPTDIIEVRETATLVAFVAAGTGVALVPEPVRSLALDGVAYRPLSDVKQRTEIVLVTRRDETSPAVLRVADLISAM